jgi:hypothetical protein
LSAIYLYRYSYRLPYLKWRTTPASRTLIPRNRKTLSSVRTFLASVFSYMALALVISGVMAWWFGHSPD